MSAEFERGVTALLGANGAGKSTLMRRIVGAERGGGAVTDESGGPPAVGYLPQDFSAPRRLTASEYLRFVAWCRSTRHNPLGMPAVQEALDAVGLSSKASMLVGALSGGMLRRLGVAQALIGGARALILDEPTVGLDPIQRRDLRELLLQLGQSRIVIVSTHLSEDVAAVADAVAIMNAGEVVFAGNLEELLDKAGCAERSAHCVDLAFSKVLEDAGA